MYSLAILIKKNVIEVILQSNGKNGLFKKRVGAVSIPYLKKKNSNSCHMFQMIWEFKTQIIEEHFKIILKMCIKYVWVGKCTCILLLGSNS